MAEALLTVRGAGRVVAGSAGSRPVAQVNPLAVRALAEAGMAWEGRVPRGFGAVERQEWDVVLTVCDDARDACPVFSGAPVAAHWGLPDPAQAGGSEAERLAAFREARDLLAWRVNRLLSLDLEGTEPGELGRALGEIGRSGPPPAFPVL